MTEIIYLSSWPFVIVTVLLTIAYSKKETQIKRFVNYLLFRS